MFMKLSKLALIAVLGAGTLALGNSEANAAPNGSHMGNYNGNFQHNNWNGNGNWNGSRNWHGQSNWHGNRCLNYGNNCRHYYHGYYYQNPWWIAPLVIGGVAATAGAYGNAHVAWCSAHYRSYNPRTNLWLGNSGRYYQCVSGY